MPNAGKSSLFNALLEYDRAIVANVKGTTRDFVTATIKMDDIEIELVDTAGIDEQSQEFATSIDAQAQIQTADQSEQAELVIACFAADGSMDDVEQFVASLERLKSNNRLVLLTKADLISSSRLLELKTKLTACYDLEEQIIATSCIDSAGIATLRKTIAKRAASQEQRAGSFVNATATRAADSLESAEFAVKLAKDAVLEDLGLEIVAAELRQSLDELGTIVGTVYTDDILDQIFGRFCIGQ